MIVKTKSGEIEGAKEDLYYSFKGIPYAEPPIGKNRWLAPKPIKPWSDVKSCKEFGSICPQNELVYEQEATADYETGSNQSEDCLTLNVWTSELDSNKPVLVWIHGGAYFLGSGADCLSDSGDICRDGKYVVVSMNYRLACFGFLRLIDLTDGKIPSTGNEALLDQVEALKWIQANISSFGGDPNNVTLIGQSAGGHSIGTLLAMPDAKGLFHKAIVCDGGSETIQPKEEANRLALKLLNQCNIDPSDVDAINSLSTEDLKAFDAKMQDPNHPYTQDLDFATQAHAKPCVDGIHIPDQPLNLIRAGSAKDVSVILGTSDSEAFGYDEIYPGLREWNVEEAIEFEMRDWLRKSKFLKISEKSAREDVKKLFDAYEVHLSSNEMDSSPAECFLKINGHKWFWVSTIRLAEALSKNSKHVYNYNWTFPGPHGSPYHGSSLPFFLDYVDSEVGKQMCGENESVRKLSAIINKIVDNFLTSGNPNKSDDVPVWPTYDDSMESLLFAETIETIKDFNSSLRKTWDQVEEKIPGNL